MPSARRGFGSLGRPVWRPGDAVQFAADMIRDLIVGIGCHPKKLRKVEFRFYVRRARARV